MDFQLLAFVFLIFASFRLTRLIVFDKITEFIRKPFLEWEEEENEEGVISAYLVIKGTGIRAWIGMLLSCYWCTGIWCSLFLYSFYLLVPSISTPFILILAIAGASGIIETLVQKWI